MSALNEKITARPFPGINIDNLPFFVSIATQTKGRTLINDWLTDERASSFMQLSKLGADIILADPHRVYITGPTELVSADITCSLALHPGEILLMSMLAAKGTSILRKAYTVNSWYEGLFVNLNKLGADIKPIYEF